MNIVVCVKQVPDTWSEKKLAASDSTLDRAATDPVMNEMDEYAVEEALRLQESSGGEVTVEGTTIKAVRETEDGLTRLEATLPAVVSVGEKINEPRYPSFKGIMAAKKKPVETYGLADLGIEAGEVGLGGAWSAVESFESAPPREAGTVVKDEGGDGADKLLEFLTSKKFV